MHTRKIRSFLVFKKFLFYFDFYLFFKNIYLIILAVLGVCCYVCGLFLTAGMGYCVVSWASLW